MRMLPKQMAGFAMLGAGGSVTHGRARQARRGAARRVMDLLGLARQARHGEPRIR